MDDAEIDLVVERPGAKTVYLEIKSSPRIDERSIKHLLSFSRVIPKGEFICASRVRQAQKIAKSLGAALVKRPLKRWGFELPRSKSVLNRTMFA